MNGITELAIMSVFTSYTNYNTCNFVDGAAGSLVMGRIWLQMNIQQQANLVT